MLSPEMQEALKAENELHADACHDIRLCVYLSVIAAAWVCEEEFTDELYEESANFIMDEILNSVILKGAMAAGGINEDGEFYYEITDHGKREIERIRDGRQEEG